MSQTFSYVCAVVNTNHSVRLLVLGVATSVLLVP